MTENQFFYAVAILTVITCLYVIIRNFLIMCKEENGTVIRSKPNTGTAKLLFDVMVYRIYPNSVKDKYYANENRKGVITKGIMDNYDTELAPLVKDIFVPIPNTFFVDSDMKEYQVYEGFIPYAVKNFRVDERTKNVYGTFTLAYLSAIVANHMSYLKIPMVKFEDKGHEGLTTEKMVLETGKYSRTSEGYYHRVNSKEKLYVKKLFKTTNYPTLEDILGKPVHESRYEKLPFPINRMVETMIRGDIEIKGVIKGIPMKNLHSLDPSTDIRLSNLRNRYFFNSHKEFKSDWLTGEFRQALSNDNTSMSFINTYEDLFNALNPKLSPFGKMYLYNFIYYYTLNHLVNKVVEYCTAKGRLGVDKEIFSELFTFKNSAGIDTTHAVKICPDYLTGVLMENEYVNSGVMKLYHMNQEENKHAISLVTTYDDYGTLLKPSMGMKADDYQPVLAFNLHKIQSRKHPKS